MQTKSDVLFHLDPPIQKTKSQSKKSEIQIYDNTFEL
jgi:hypothetical protein